MASEFLQGKSQNLYRTNICKIFLFYASKNSLPSVPCFIIIIFSVDFITNKYTVYLLVYMLFLRVSSHKGENSVS